MPYNNQNNTYIEYACYDEPDSYIVKRNVFEAIEYGAGGISIPSIHFGAIAEYIPDGVALSCPIDFPDGYLKPKQRIGESINAIKMGATALDLVVNYSLFKNGKELEFIKDIEAHSNLCWGHNVTLRAIVDYRNMNIPEFKQIFKILSQNGVDFAFCSNGRFITDCIDDMVMCMYMKEEFGVETIANSNMYLESHFNQAVDSGIFGIRFNNINAMKNCLVGV